MKEKIMSDRISVIVPAYNVENYIEKCISSVLNQTYENIEIIIAVNGCTDNTKTLVDKLAKENDNIVVIAVEKAGVSNARNIAIERSTGKYIMFLDSDDYYDINMVRNMYDNIVKYNVELVVCNYSSTYSNGDIELNPCNEKMHKNDVRTYMKAYAENFHTLYYGVLWNKIYMAEIIKKQGITFDTSISLGEDSLFNIQYLRYVKNVFLDNRSLYYYYRNNSVSLTQTIPSYEVWNMSVVRYQYCLDTYKYMKLIDECKEKLAFRILSDLMISIDDLIENKTIKRNVAKIQLKKMLNNKVVDFGYKNAIKLSLAHKIIKAARKNNNYSLMIFLLSLKYNIQNWRNK